MKYCTACKTKYDDSVSFCSIDGEVLEADPASIVDTVLDGQYQMEALLGKGGMGAVYRARHILLGDRVAIKVLPPEVRNNAEWLRRFRREGQAARRFRHPNSVTVYDLRTAADGTIYMVMEYVEGHTLDLAMKTRGRFSAAEAYEILTPIMSVLDTAHSMGVVHRDLKPENIMIGNATENGPPVVKLLDLGIAKMREIAGGDNGGNTALTMAGQVLGTPYYMSPEQWGEIPRDGNPEIDGRADIYSLGLVFYEMVSGRRPFASNTLNELRRDHVTTTPKPLYQVVADVPRGFSAAVERATAKDRGDRQATAQQLADELRAGLSTPIDPRTGEVPPDLAETITLGKVDTKSDVNAPTVITMDSAPTSAPAPSAPSTVAPTVVERRQPEPPPRPVDASMTVAESAGMASSATAIPNVAPAVPAPAPRPAPIPAPAPVSQKKKSYAGLIIGVVALLVIVAVVAGASIFLWNRSRTTTPVGTTSGSTTTTVATPTEVGRYWLELQTADGSQPPQVSASVPLASGQSFKFHFVFSEPGYVYIFGPGEKNQPTAFLTAKPMPESGVKTNQVSGGKDFSFPSGQGNAITLDTHPGTDVFTIIFAKSPLSSPAFLNELVTGKPLSAAEQAELKLFVGQHTEKPPVTELDESNPRAQQVRVKVPAEATSNPVVFDIRIQHN
jgi:eukaryotic-like serine/threonine-protein kinase